MLADNTNTLVWVGVAVGVVAVLGAAALLIFPGLLSTMHEKLDSMIDSFSKGNAPS